MFACFVDLKKVFDTIWHNGLFLQLIQNGIGGKIYDLIKSKYSDYQCCVKIGNKRTEFFKQGKGCIDKNNNMTYIDNWKNEIKSINKLEILYSSTNY